MVKWLSYVCRLLQTYGLTSLIIQFGSPRATEREHIPGSRDKLSSISSLLSIKTSKLTFVVEVLVK